MKQPLTPSPRARKIPSISAGDKDPKNAQNSSHLRPFPLIRERQEGYSRRELSNAHERDVGCGGVVIGFAVGVGDGGGGRCVFDGGDGDSEGA